MIGYSLRVFGHKAKIEGLERALSALRASKDDAERELQREREQLRAITHERDQLRAHLSHPKPRTNRASPPSAPPPHFEPIDNPLGEEDPWVRARYSIRGPVSQVVTLDLLLRCVHWACDIGSTVWYSMMVDGDGDGYITVDREGAPAGLAPEEEDWLFTPGDKRPPTPEHLRGAEAYFAESPEILTFDIV